jgi:hypothetical protein
LKELAEEQQKKTKKYKLKYEELKNENEELKKEIKKLNISHPNHTINEDRKEYSDLLGENNNSGNDELFKLRKNNKMLQDKLDEEVTKTEVLKVIAENEKQKIEKIINKYKLAKEKNNELIKKIKELDINFTQALNEEINNYKKHNELFIYSNEKERNALKNEINNKNNEIKELSVLINELQNENGKLNVIKNEYEEKIKNLNNEIYEYKKKIEDEKNDGTERRYNRLISVLNIETNEEKNEDKENKENNEFRRFSNFDFFEKKQLTGKFGGLEEDENSNNKNILNDNSNLKRSILEEKENEEKGDSKKENKKNEDNRIDFNSKNNNKEENKNGNE